MEILVNVRFWACWFDFGACWVYSEHDCHGRQAWLHFVLVVCYMALEFLVGVCWGIDFDFTFNGQEDFWQKIEKRCQQGLTWYNHNDIIKVSIKTLSLFLERGANGGIGVAEYTSWTVTKDTGSKLRRGGHETVVYR